MPVSFPIRDGAVQLVQVQNGRGIVGVGFGDPATQTNRWLIQTSEAPIMQRTSTCTTNFEPLATQVLANRWQLAKWVSASDPTHSHTTADDALNAHDSRGYLRHRAAEFTYIKTKYARFDGLKDAGFISDNIPAPFPDQRQTGQSAPRSIMQCDPQFYRMMPIDQDGVIMPGRPSLGHMFAPANGPNGSTTPPHSLEIWFIKRSGTFPSPPDGFGFALEVDDTPGAPDGSTPLVDVVAYLDALPEYVAIPNADKSTTIVSTTSYPNTRPHAP